MKKVLVFMKPYWWIALLAPLAMIGEVLVDLWQPKLMSTIVDEGVLQGNMDVILRTGITMLVMVIFGGLFGIGSAAFSGVASQNFANDLRKAVFQKTMSLSLQQTDRFTTGSLVTRMTNDITQVQHFMDMAMRMFVRSFMLFIGGIVMMLGLNVNFGMVVLIALPIELVLIVLFVRKTSPIFSVVQKKLDRVNAVMQENVSGARVVKAYTREGFESDRFEDANSDLMQTNMRVMKIMALMMPIMMILMNLSIIAIIYIGGLQVQAQAMQVGSVMAAVTYVTQILMSMMMVSMMFQSISRASASAKRLQEVLDTEPAVIGGTKKLERVDSIVFENVGFHYPSVEGQQVLQNISLEIKKGEHIAILGATGTGKSSFVNLLPRFYDVSEGRILINDCPIGEYDLHSLREKIGIVLQKSELFSGSIKDNILWGDDKADAAQVERAASVAQAEEFILAMPDKYDGYVAEKGASLSGGQKQRMSIARSVLKHPDVLIFDDSTSALDLGTEARLQAAVRETLQGTTLITIAQRISSVKNCDRIVVLEEGEIAAIGTHEALLAESEIYQDIYASQVKGGGAEDGTK